MAWTQALLVLGATITVISLCSVVVRLSEAEEVSAEKEIAARLSGELVLAGAMGD
jgi:hypothetical protein